MNEDNFFDPTEDERDEIRRAYAPLTPVQRSELEKHYGPAEPFTPEPASYEREEDRITRLIVQAYGLEWLKSVSYDGVKSRDNAYIWRYAAMEELRIPLAPTIRREFGAQISEFRTRLPK